jgi:hypothetical protein
MRLAGRERTAEVTTTGESDTRGSDAENGKIIISPNYLGPFIIRNFTITNVTQPITTQVLALDDKTSLPVGGEFYTLFLTSFQADSVISMSAPCTWITFRVPALKSVSIANLESIESFYGDLNPALTISLPQLESTLSLEISGCFSR